MHVCRRYSPQNDVSAEGHFLEMTWDQVTWRKHMRIINDTFGCEQIRC